MRGIRELTPSVTPTICPASRSAWAEEENIAIVIATRIIKRAIKPSRAIDKEFLSL
jgi:hypothetical protein